MAWANTLSSLNTNARSSQRKAVRLTAMVYNGWTSEEVEIVNLSPTGALLLLPAHMRKPSSLDVDFPEIGRVKATVVWHDERLVGCEFDAPLPRAAVSAALLKSQPVSAATAPSSEQKTAHQSKAEPDSLSPRTRLFVIAGLACLAWAPVAVPLFLWLR